MARWRSSERFEAERERFVRGRPDFRIKIDNALKKLSENPPRRSLNIEKVAGTERSYSIRVDRILMVLSV
jgi:hypothetical protein